MIGIEKCNSLDINPFEDTVVSCALIERINVKFVGNNISHRGCENLSDFDHHRIHCLNNQNILDGKYGGLVKVTF